MKTMLYGYYQTSIHLPLSGVARGWRRLIRRWRNKQGGLLQQVALPGISWKACTGRRLTRIWESDKGHLNVRTSELGVINLLAAECEDGALLFEIGTFDGRTSLNLAFSCPPRCRVHTLDMAPTMPPLSTPTGARIAPYRQSHPAIAAKITRLFGDSATFNFAPYVNACSLVFVDGTHTYEYAMSDSRAAMKMVQHGGIILWHDYGIFEGVTNALEDIENTEHLGLKHIHGTSLVWWRQNERGR